MAKEMGGPSRRFSNCAIESRKLEADICSGLGRTLRAHLHFDRTRDNSELRPPRVDQFSGQAVLIVLRGIGFQAGETLSGGIDDVKVAVRTVVPAQPNRAADGLIIGSVDLHERREHQERGGAVVSVCGEGGLGLALMDQIRLAVSFI